MSMRIEIMIPWWIAVGTQRPALLLAAGLVMTVAGAALAQATPGDLPVGARIRLRAPGVGVPWTTTGVVDSLSADTIYVRDLRDPPSLRRIGRLAVPLMTVTQLDVSRGRKSRWSRARKGALWGLAVYGLVAGSYIVHESSTCRGSDCFGEGMAWIGLAAGAPWAAGIGGTIAFSLPVESWRRIAVSSR